MMRRSIPTGAFRRDYKRIKKADATLDASLVPVLTLLSNGSPPPAKHVDHPLNGEWKGYRDCHVRPDLVLIYKIDKETLTLVRLGSHSDLFG